MTSLLQVRRMVTSSFEITCFKLVMNLRSCRVKLAASLQSKTAATLLQTKFAIRNILKVTLFCDLGSNQKRRLGIISWGKKACGGRERAFPSIRIKVK
ncbi:hypothetical protein AVEN_165349-1 [Araneus ventricosus]|uniref:Uncharacterized protein n=1 Tax=Araneus ventricosus TaxID=182803 RepID=A0A4Y2ATU4_ARAVE|nr:hypothetical protein AVEN_165349-1 [Araneus ventricosus]